MSCLVRFLPAPSSIIIGLVYLYVGCLGLISAFRPVPKPLKNKSKMQKNSSRMKPIVKGRGNMT